MEMREDSHRPKNIQRRDDYTTYGESARYLWLGTSK